MALLPALDSTTMGWTDRGWFMGAHTPRLFDRNGNAGPTIWVDGRVVGGWTQLRDGRVVWQVLEKVGTAAERAIKAEGGRLEELFGSSRVVPRFRTPLEQELSA